MASTKTISVRGAREHNLDNVSVNIPKNKFVVCTGLSGSGKSSLAFDTLYAEGQRKYVESLSAYARQFLGIMKKPDVDSISGLSPAIAIEQKTTSNNPRSTVGTVTEIHDYLRLLFARVGIPTSPATGLPIRAQTPEDMVRHIQKHHLNERIFLTAPVVRARKGEHVALLQSLAKQGYVRFLIDGTVVMAPNFPTIDKNKKHDISVIVDRLRVTPESNERLVGSVETILPLSDGLLGIGNYDNPHEPVSILSSRYACPVSGFTVPALEPRLFSFNSPQGACPVCKGLGHEIIVDETLVIPDKRKPLLEAIAPWRGHYTHLLLSLARHLGIDPETPFGELPQEAQNTILHGTEEPIHTTFQTHKSFYRKVKAFEGVLPNIARRFRETESTSQREELARFQSKTPCHTCKGKRLRPEALAVRVGEVNIADVCAQSIEESLSWIQKQRDSFSSHELLIGRPILRELENRLSFLVNVGLSYLTLDRNAGGLSGGESQRIRLASQIGSGLTGVLYVLDEPSIGLHQRDNAKLLQTLFHLRDLGNTVLVVEHDEETIRTADYVIDLGPKAGKQGGKLVYAGSPEGIKDAEESLTGDYLSGRKKIPVPHKRKTSEKFLRLTGASGHNLQNVDISIPLGTLTCVTGVSGSGKSTLIVQTLWPILSQKLMHSSTKHPQPYGTIEGYHHLDKVIDIDQSPIGRTPRSNPATYTGLFTHIREWFATLPESRARGYGPGRFSFNVNGGRCAHCKGDGVIQVEMHFLPDVFVTCEHCKGARYNPQTLEIRYKGKSIADILTMSVREAMSCFHALPHIKHKLETLDSVGLGYIALGQPATTLSGGEAQRVKLAKELTRKATGRTLYLLDEPTTGLHSHDVKKLLHILEKLRDQGNTIVLIEHNLDAIKTADFIIDMGPEGGKGGGECVAYGTPETIAKHPTSITGMFLAVSLQLDR